MNDKVIRVDLLYHLKLCWLSQGNVLVKIVFVRGKIIEVFKGNNKHCDLLDPKFYIDGVFLCDVMSKQNEVNISLQGRKNIFMICGKKIKVFRKKNIFKSLLTKLKLSEKYFSQFTEIISENEDTYRSFEE